jgi:hypothetical protein
MNPTSGDGQNESTEKQWPRVLKLNREEFRQSVAVAELAVRLCELKKASTKAPSEKEDFDPAQSLDEAWKLIEGARDRVLRPQTHAEYLAAQGGSREAAGNVVERSLSASHVPFEKLCDPKRKGNLETIHRVNWKVLTEPGFDDRFWKYWRYCGEKWKYWKVGEKPTPSTQSECAALATLSQDAEEWKKCGQRVLDCWKREGVPPNTFLAFASGYFDFELGIEFITGEHRPERALPWFRRFLKSRFANEHEAERAMAQYREKRFTLGEPFSLKDEFAKWKHNEKSDNAKLSREARGKRGS